MKKKIALLVYPEFSLQEVANLMSLFRWNYDSKTEIISSSLQGVKCEEGITIFPDKTCDEFNVNDYDCLILSGCSDFTLGIKDEKINSFLANLRKHDNFVIAAICGGPLFLAKAGLLKSKKYTCSLYYNMMELFDFFEIDNFIPAPVVVDQNIITAVGGAFNDFAVNVARKLDYECNDIIFRGYTNTWQKDDYYAYLSEEDLNDFKKEFAEYIKKAS